MALSPEVRQKLQARIDELKKRMLYDANDLDYETHLNQVRELQKIISAAKQRMNEKGTEYSVYAVLSAFSVTFSFCKLHIVLANPIFYMQNIFHHIQKMGIFATVRTFNHSAILLGQYFTTFTTNKRKVHQPFIIFSHFIFLTNDTIHIKFDVVEF